MPGGSEYHPILIVDVEGSGRRSDAGKRLLRSDLYAILMASLARAGVAWDACRDEDRGDGVYFLLPPNLPKTLLAGALVASIDAVLAEYRPARQRLRLRICLGAGEVHIDGRGSSGRAVDEAFALIGADEVRDDLKADADARCVLVISDAFYDAISPSYDRYLSGTEFRPITIDTKNGRRKAWVRRFGPEPATPTLVSTDEPWQVRIGPIDGPVGGLGILVDDQTVLTCAHAVPGGERADKGISVSFRAAGSRPVTAKVRDWSVAPGGDVQIAVLRLSGPPPQGIGPVPLALLGDVAAAASGGPTGGAVDVDTVAEHSPAERGFPACGAGRDSALPDARVRLSAAPAIPVRIARRLGPRGELLVLEPVADPPRLGTDRRSGPPWSPGLGVVDEGSRSLVGMVVDSDDSTWPPRPVMVSIDVLRGRSATLRELPHQPAHPEKASRRSLPRNGPRPLPVPATPAPAPPNSPRSVPDRQRDRRGPGSPTALEITEKLQELATMETENARTLVMRELPYGIGQTTKRHHQTRLDILALVKRCMDFHDGVDRLYAVLERLEGDSEPLRDLRRLLYGDAGVDSPDGRHESRSSS